MNKQEKNKNLKKKTNKKLDEFKLPKLVRNDQEEYIKNLIELYEREKESRCYFQLERDKLVKMRDIEKEKFDDLKMKLFEAQEELSKYEQFHNKEILNLNKKIKYLIGERQIKINDLKLQHEIQNKIYLKENLESKNELFHKLQDTIEKLSKDRINMDDTIRNMMNENENKISKLQSEYSQTVSSVEKACESRFDSERRNFFLITRNAIHEITELKNRQINEIMSLNNKSYEEMRFFFRDLTQNLINLVENLNTKNQTYLRNLKDLENKYIKAKNELEKFNQENEKLSKENKSLNSKSNLYLKNTKLYQTKNIEYSNLSKKYKNLDLKYEALLLTYENIKNENKRLENCIENLIFKIKERFENLNFMSTRKEKLIINKDSILFI